MPGVQELYKKNRSKSLCKGKTEKKCKKVRGCKTATGTKRKFCRKIKNLSYNKGMPSRKNKGKKMTSLQNLKLDNLARTMKKGISKKAQKDLKNLGIL